MAHEEIRDIYDDLQSMNPDNKKVFLLSVTTKDPVPESRDLIIIEIDMQTTEEILVAKDLGIANNLKVMPWTYLETDCPENTWYLIDTNPIADGNSEVYLVKACNLYMAIDVVQRALSLKDNTHEITSIQEFELDVIA